MTTNIKLFENWIVEEEAAVAPAVTPAATTPVVKPVDYTSQNTIGNNKQIKVTISCIAPFDITQSTLMVVGFDLFTNIYFKYILDSKTWKCTDNNAFDQAVKSLEPITDRSKAKRSIAGIIFDALTLAGAPTAWTYNPNLAGPDSDKTIDRLVAAADINSFRGSVSADTTQISELAGIPSTPNDRTPIGNLAVITEVNIDNLIPTGKFNIVVNNAYASGRPFTTVEAAISKIAGSGANPAVKQKMTLVINDLITKSKSKASIPI